MEKMGRIRTGTFGFICTWYGYLIRDANEWQGILLVVLISILWYRWVIKEVK